MSRHRIWGTVLLGLTLLAAARAAPLDRAALWSEIGRSPGVGLAVGARDVARARLDAAQGWQITATGNAGLSKTPADEDIARDVSAGLRVVRPGPATQDDARLALVQALQRAEFGVQRARLAEWRARVEAWNELAAAQTGLNGASVRLQAARLGEEVTAGRATNGAATPLQLEAARLDRQRAELGQTQATLRLDRARAELRTLGVTDLEASAENWTALPLPPAGFQGQRGDVLEAELDVQGAEATLAQARRDAQPTFGAQGQYSAGHVSLSGSLDREGNAEAAASLALNNVPAPVWSLGLSARLSLDGRAARVVQASERNLTLARAALEQARERAVRDVQARAAAVQAAAGSLDLAGAALTAQRQEEAVATSRHQAGLTGAPDLAQARVNTAKATDALTDARRELDRLILDLWEAAGWLPGDVRP